MKSLTAAFFLTNPPGTILQATCSSRGLKHMVVINMTYYNFFFTSKNVEKEEGGNNNK